MCVRDVCIKHVFNERWKEPWGLPGLFPGSHSRSLIPLILDHFGAAHAEDVRTIGVARIYDWQSSCLDCHC